MLAEVGVRSNQWPDIGASVFGKLVVDPLVDTDLVCSQRHLFFFENLLEEEHPAVLLNGQPQFACRTVLESDTYSAPSGTRTVRASFEASPRECCRSRPFLRNT